MSTDWNPLLAAEFDKPYWHALQSFVASEREQHAVYPAQEDVFAAFRHTSFDDTKVVILGQDPYHGPQQAHGLCFSVQRDVATPPSLANIFKELHADVGMPISSHGNLLAWAQRGVLLLNTTLTVRAGQAGSHQGKGWETFTDEVIRLANSKPFVVFVLWGAQARKKKSLIDVSRHAVVESAHPSPLSAHQGFTGSRPFSQINAALRAGGLSDIDWALD